MNRDMTIAQPPPTPDEYQDCLTVPCPRPSCRAPIRERCRRPAGLALPSGPGSHIPHSERVDRWQRDGRPSAGSPQRRLGEATASWYDPREWE